MSITNMLCQVLIGGPCERDLRHQCAQSLLASPVFAALAAGAGDKQTALPPPLRSLTRDDRALAAKGAQGGNTAVEHTGRR